MSRPVLRGILFDLDGVLVDSYEAWFHLVNATAAHFGHGSIGRDTFETTWGQGVEADVEAFFTEQTIEEVGAFYDAHFLDYLEHVDVNADTKPVFDELEDRGWLSAVVTNTPTETALRLVGHAGIDPTAVVGATDVAHGKPAPDMLYVALERLALGTDEVVMVGDSRYDREAAAAAGVQFVGFQTGGDYRIETLTELLTIGRDSPDR